MTTGERIRDLRIKKEMSQKELADMINVERITISAFERDRVEPNTEKLFEIAEILGASVSYLIGESEN